MPTKESLYLLDAMALAYRAHFAFINRPLINTKGLDTSAVYGFTTALLKLLEDHDPDHIAVVFDEGPTFRDELYAEYKAHRPPQPEGIKQGLPFIRRIVEAFDIPCLSVKGFEADDVIGTLAKRAEEEHVECVIVSPDKDFRQLLSDCVSMLRPAYKGQEFDLETDETFRAEYGVEPIKFIDILALLGDTADNVPGVPGIGKKTAPKLIAEYGSVEALLDAAEGLKGKRVREGLLENRDAALLSKKLVTIDTEVPLDFDWHALRRTEPDLDTLADLFQELEFRSLLKRSTRQVKQVRGETGDLFAAVETLDSDLDFDFGPYEEVKVLDEASVHYRSVRSMQDLNAFAAKLAKETYYAFDTETTSVEPMWASLVGCSFSWAEGDAWFIPTPLPDGTQTDAILEVLRPLLERDDQMIVGQNVKYDYEVMARHGVTLGGRFFDTMIAHYLVEPEAEHNLDAIASAYLSYKPVPISELIGTGKKQISMRDVPLDQLTLYACEDADITLRLVDPLTEKLEADALYRIAEDVEFPLIEVLADIELRGVKINPQKLAEISGELARELEKIERDIYQMAGESFNIGSPQQLGQILFEKMGLPVQHKTSTGKPSTNERVLNELATLNPMPGLVLDWRQLAKLKSTYVDKLGDLVHPETIRIHTDFNQTVTATGRLSSSNPNLQNIPIRTETGRQVRRAFVAEPPFRFVTADYAQIELRILASMSGDAGLIAAFEAGEDIHTATAARVFDIDAADVTRTQRSRVKQVNYGIPYGISAFGLAQRLRIGNKDAQALIEAYNQTYPRVMQFLNEVLELARERGYAETLMGRRRYIPNLTSRSHRDRAYAERVAVNMPIQGTQADMIKVAMVRLHDRFQRAGYRSRMILQVHDELVFEVHPDELSEVTGVIDHEMKHALPLNVPIEVDIGVGDDWLEAH